jgi:hypothetical protein
VVAGDDARSHIWTVCGNSDAIVPSYGPIFIVLLLGFRGGGQEGNQNLGGTEVIWGGRQRSSFICNNKTLCGVVHSAHLTMDCAQTERMRRCPWCGDDVNVLVWGAPTPWAMVKWQIRRPPWPGTTILINFGGRGVSGTSTIVRRII